MRPGRGGRGRGGGARRRGEPMRPLVAGAARPGAAPHRVGCGFLWGAARRTVDIYAPNRAHVPVVRADALAIVGIPDRRRVVLCCCEDEVALTVVLDHGQRSLMALDHNGADLPHGCCSLSASLLLLLLLLNRVSAGDLEAWRRVRASLAIPRDLAKQRCSIESHRQASRSPAGADAVEQQQQQQQRGRKRAAAMASRQARLRGRLTWMAHPPPSFHTTHHTQSGPRAPPFLPSFQASEPGTRAGNKRKQARCL